MYQCINTWDRRYQKAIREPIHLAHLRVGRSRQLYGQKSHSAVSRQDNYCSRAASQPASAALLSKTNAPQRPTITPAALTSIITVNGFSLRFMSVCTQTNGSGQTTLELTLQSPLTACCVFNGFYSESQTCTIDTAIISSP